MKILQLIQKKQFRGAEVFCCQLSNHLLDLGHQIEIMSIFEGKASLPYKGDIKSISKAKKYRYYDFKSWKKLNGFIELYKPDIVQANAADTLKYAVLSKLLYKWEVPIIYRNASAASFYIKNPIAKQFNRFLLKEVDLIISVSLASKKDLNALYPFTESKSTVIPVGIEDKEHTGILPLPGNNATIIHVGSFTNEKNHKALLRIFKATTKSNPNVVLHLVGEGPLKPEVENSVSRLGLSKKVMFHGVLDNPLSYIKAADVLVLPSIIEGLPGVLLEAMFCKVPVVAYNVGGISEIITEKTGSLIQKGNEKAFAEAIVKTLQEPDQGQIENAYNMVVKRYMNVQIAERFEEAYGKVVG